MSWYYAVNGQQAGPVEDAELQRMAAAGEVTPATLVWRAGMDAWATLGSLQAPAGPTEKCAHCGQAQPASRVIELAGGLVCASCKPAVLQRIREGLSPMANARPYAGFWIRLVARMIDNTITSIAGYVFQIPLLVVVARMDKKEPELGLMAAAMGLAVVMSLATAGAYEAWFLVKKGATPGKMILGLKVIKARGGGIGWGLGVGRFFAYMLSAFTMYIGYIMAGWDEEKRALHDRICDTRVVTGS